MNSDSNINATGLLNYFALYSSRDTQILTFPTSYMSELAFSFLVYIKKRNIIEVGWFKMFWTTTLAALFPTCRWQTCELGSCYVGCKFSVLVLLNLDLILEKTQPSCAVTSDATREMIPHCLPTKIAAHSVDQTRSSSAVK